jgi:hypothetical protein
MNQAYAASGGQYDAHGIPNGKGYVPPVLSPAQVKQQDNAARQAQKQATDNLEYDLKTKSRPRADVIDGVTIPAGVTNTAEYLATVHAIDLQRKDGVNYPGCSGQQFHLGACPSEAGAAGITPQQVKQSAIGAAWVIASAIPVGDLLDLAGIGRAAEDSGVMFSSGSAVSNADVVSSGAGLARTSATVSDAAARAGVNLGNTAVKIIEDPEYLRYLDSQGACACAPYDLPGGIHLGPASFIDQETLAATLAHEMEHVSQYAAGYVPGSGDLAAMEAAAYAAEGPAVARLLGMVP